MVLLLVGNDDDGEIAVVSFPQVMVARKLEPARVKGPARGEPRIAGHAHLARRDDDPSVAEKLNLHCVFPSCGSPSINGSRNSFKALVFATVRWLLYNAGPMVKVKICGNANLDDAMAAVQAGADAVGFVFYAKSPRAVDPKTAAEIISRLPPFVAPVGVFVNEELTVVRRIMQLGQGDVAFLHDPAGDGQL